MTRCINDEQSRDLDFVVFLHISGISDTPTWQTYSVDDVGLCNNGIGWEEGSTNLLGDTTSFALCDRSLTDLHISHSHMLPYDPTYLV